MPGSAALREKNITERKIVSISAKRQITIPQKFFTALGFADEAECLLCGDKLVLRPAQEQNGGEFAEQILADLIRQGLSGEELLTAFKRQQAKVRPAVEAMLAEAGAAARGESKYVAYDDVFMAEED